MRENIKLKSNQSKIKNPRSNLFIIPNPTELLSAL